MPYPTLPDRAIPYHADGTVVKVVTAEDGVIYTLSAADLAELNDQDYADVFSSTSYSGKDVMLVFFFPEKRVISGIFALCKTDVGNIKGPYAVEGSNDTTNGVDGTWEAASAPSGYNGGDKSFDAWRDSVASISFSGAMQTIRIKFSLGTPQNNYSAFEICHLYGHKGSGETPDDIIFLDAENADAEFSSPLDFGAVGAGSSSIRQIKIQNASASITANSIDIVVNDALDYIRIGDTSSGPWVTSMNISSLGPGVKSTIIYVKSEPSAPPTPLEPVRAPITVTVGSWT